MLLWISPQAGVQRPLRPGFFKSGVDRHPEDVEFCVPRVMPSVRCGTVRVKVCVRGRVCPCIVFPLGMILSFHLTNDISCTLGETSESVFGGSRGSVFGASFTHQDNKHVVKAVEGKLRNLRECPSIDYAARFLV